MLILSPRFFRLVRLMLVFLACFTAVLSAEDFKAPEEQLAHKVSAITGPGAVSVDFSNRASLPKSDFDTIRRELLTELASLGLRFVPAEQAAATVRISLSEDLQSYLWIAEIAQGTNAPVVTMATSPRGDIPTSTHVVAPLTLHKTLLWQQSVRMLDATVLEGNPAHLIILDADKVAAYRFQDNHWQAEQLLPIVHTHSWPRDARGRLVLRRDRLLDAYLPGIVCETQSGKPSALTCRPSDDPWPLGSEQSGVSAFYAPTRNYFTGALSPGIGKQTTTAPFYSATVLFREKYILGIFAGIDGQVHLLDGITDRSAGHLGWGSSVAAIRTTCGSEWQVLASHDGLGASDTVTAYDFPDREPIPASQPLDFPGPITEMWAESGNTGTIAIIRNSETGLYEAYRLTVTCNL